MESAAHSIHGENVRVNRSPTTGLVFSKGGTERRESMAVVAGPDSPGCAGPPIAKRSRASPPWWVVAATVACVALFLSHARLYLSTPHGEILQAPISRITAELLSERRPVVTEDRVVDPTELVRTVLRWQYVWSSGSGPCPEGASVSDARFTLVFFPLSDGTVVIECARPEAVPTPPVAVMLAAGRTLILPPGWRYSPMGQTAAQRVRLHDPVTAIMSSVVRRVKS